MPLDHPTFQTLQQPLLQRGLLQKLAEVVPISRIESKPLQKNHNVHIMHVTPQSRGYGDVTATYIRRLKYPHIYTLSISTYKNESICGALYIPI